MKERIIKIGFSPCPNDTFIFDALVNQRIDTGNYKFVPTLADVEQLNNYASNNLLQITKLSVAAFADVSDKYIVLESGSAMGNGVGPILVSKADRAEQLNSKSAIAIPGKKTTANLLLSIFYPQYSNKVETLFSDIEQTVVIEKVDAGLLIHEGRFTYQRHGLQKIIDLGEVWESRTKMPLPLGCICADRNMHQADRMAINELIKSSILFAFKNRNASKEYVHLHAQEMDDEVIAKHIELYVNDFSVALGVEGKKAISFLLNKGYECGLLPQITLPIFNS